MADEWKDRLVAVSAAQGRYLWALLVMGIFYFALPTSGSVKVPLVELPLPVRSIALTGPAVLFFLILVILGSARAYGTAEQQATKAAELPSEALDHAPNPLDLAVYTTAASPEGTKRVLRLTYPLFVSLFAAEAVWLLVVQFTHPASITGTWAFRVLGVLTGIPVLVMLVKSWWALLQFLVTG
jgi:cytochrome bd-type quinol oxidase subunit 1